MHHSATTRAYMRLALHGPCRHDLMHRPEQPLRCESCDNTTLKPGLRHVFGDPNRTLKTRSARHSFSKRPMAGELTRQCRIMRYGDKYNVISVELCLK